MSRENIHFGTVCESNLPLITDTETFEPLEEDLKNLSVRFRDRMGRFMMKRQRNKFHYKIGKKYKFFMGELAMKKVQTPSSLLSPTFEGPYRIIELFEKGAKLKDVKSGSEYFCSFDNMRKINFDELLTLLPQNFDDEIASTLGLYRYKKAEKSEAPEEESINVEEVSTKNKDSFNVTESLQGKALRSGKLYNLNIVSDKIFKQEKVSSVKWRNETIKSVPSETSVKSILKINYKRMHRPLDTANQRELDDRSLENRIKLIQSYNQAFKRSRFCSALPGTLIITLDQVASRSRVKFGSIKVYFYEPP
jgi:hypothetical protein